MTTDGTIIDSIRVVITDVVSIRDVGVKLWIYTHPRVQNWVSQLYNNSMLSNDYHDHAAHTPTTTHQACQPPSGYSGGGSGWVSLPESSTRFTSSRTVHVLAVDADPGRDSDMTR